MISITKGDKGQYVSYSDAPVQHTYARESEESCNLGLADGFRLTRKELVLPPGVEPTREAIEQLRKTQAANYGRGPGGVKMIGQLLLSGALDNEEEDEMEKGMTDVLESGLGTEGMPVAVPGRKGFQLRPVFKPVRGIEDLANLPTVGGGRGRGKRFGSRSSVHDSDTTSTSASVFGNDSIPVIEEPAPVAVFNPAHLQIGHLGQDFTSVALKRKRGKGKPNGYIMFIQHRGRQEGTGGSINHLQDLYDKDWKALSEEERAAWRAKCKAGPARGNGGGEGDSRQRVGGNSYNQRNQARESEMEAAEMDDAEDYGY